MKLDSNQIELLQSFANDNDYTLRTDYRGRGMYGKQCIGFDTDRNQNLFSLGIDLARFLTENSEYDLLEAFQNTAIHTDSMGMGQIVYFPRMEAEIAPPDDPELDELEDDDHLIIDDEDENDKIVKEMVIAKFDAKTALDNLRTVYPAESIIS